MSSERDTAKELQAQDAPHEAQTAPLEAHAQAQAASPEALPQADAPKAGAGDAAPGWYAGKAPLLLFMLKFCALTTLFYVILQRPFCQDFVSVVTVAEARLAGLILNLLGQHNHVDGTTLWAGNQSVIKVVSECSGFDFLSFFSAAVLVFPVPFKKKLAGMLIGIPLLLALNLVRIVSLYLVDVHFPSIFDIVHEQIWALILIAATIILYITWMKWAGPSHRSTPDVA